MTVISSNTPLDERTKKQIFWACFVALVATSFVFGVRANVIGDLAVKFDLSEAQKGTILGVGLWPFAISIVIFSLIIDKIGYKTAAVIAIVCHVASLLLTIFATGFTSLYWATFLVAIANGIVEAFINPVVATVFRENKAKWLNILHAGWPAGMALGALFTVLLGGLDWQLKYGMCFIPVIIYTILILPCKFPPNERVAAGIPYRDMLGEVGAIGFFIIGWLMTMGVAQIAGVQLNWTVPVGVAAVVAVLAGLYTRGPGNWMFLLILLTMGPLATTELGTDSWMPDLLGAELSPKGATWVFIYVSTIMTIMRFYAGPIVHKFSPIGLLVLSAAIAIVGLMFLSKAAAFVVVIAATVYAIGKTFLWSTTLGMVSEQFPKGGALTLNGVSAVGVLGMGIIGAPFMGVLQDREVDAQLSSNAPAIYEQINGDGRQTIFGEVPSLNLEAAAALGASGQEQLSAIQKASKKGSFAKVAILPGFMLACYLILFFYFKSKGGYKPIDLHS
ncbi:MAG: MFS transporter [Verrucomicrobia bacterium]|nr:MFS transporter [Verrucomicrobiota bacterium]MDA1069173.1 MFS transporter [Verrucomicrobiota bacterium]